MMDEREKIKSSDILSQFDWMDRNLNFSFFFPIHSLVVRRRQQNWQIERKNEREREDADTIVLIKYLYNILLSYEFASMFGHKREKYNSYISVK
jgi:hypothetical protein